MSYQSVLSNQSEVGRGAQEGHQSGGLRWDVRAGGGQNLTTANQINKQVISLYFSEPKGFFGFIEETISSCLSNTQVCHRIYSECLRSPEDEPCKQTHDISSTVEPPSLTIYNGEEPRTAI